MSTERSTCHTDCVDVIYIGVLFGDKDMCKHCQIKNNPLLKCTKFKKYDKDKYRATVSFGEKYSDQKWPNEVWLNSGLPCTVNTAETGEYLESIKGPFVLPAAEIASIILSQFDVLSAQDLINS